MREEMRFDVDAPPEDPPPGVAHPMLWRVAVRVSRDHSRAVRDAADLIVCLLCLQEWPCFGRRLAYRALVAAWQAAPAGESLGVVRHSAETRRSGG
ncbi:MAG TPA: hypothetical protein VFB74_05900 [Kribbellaceae bacterium]|nr:hypothetical protein [Kribbellaceae bacterium]